MSTGKWGGYQKCNTHECHEATWGPSGRQLLWSGGMQKVLPALLHALNPLDKLQHTNILNDTKIISPRPHYTESYSTWLNLHGAFPILPVLISAE